MEFVTRVKISDPVRDPTSNDLDISKAIFRKLATHGVVFNAGTFRSIKATYYRVALDFIESYHNDAIINGLQLDVHREEQAVELFAGNIMKAGERFLENPMETPFIPHWHRVLSNMPDLLREMRQAVKDDRADYDRLKHDD